MSTLNLEARINGAHRYNNMDVVRELIAECFEAGFYPWDNPKFQVFLIDVIRGSLQSGLMWGKRSVTRGWVYASTALGLLNTQPEYGHISQAIGHLLLEPVDDKSMRTVPELVHQTQLDYDRRIQRSLRRAQKKLTTTG